MFRKIVSNLAFSPALVGQLSFYAKRLRREQVTRRLGLIFTAFALIVQSFAVFQPPEAANASSPADFVSGGVSSVDEFLKAYDNNGHDIKGLFNSLGITRAEIAAAKSGTVGKDGFYNWSMTSLYSNAQGQRAYTYYHADGSSKTVYHRPMALTQEGRAPYPVFIGHSAKFGWFAIKMDCGNLITKKRPPEDKLPTASCSNLNPTLVDRTRVRFDAKADVPGGAKIKSYTFVVRNASGTAIHTKEFASGAESASYTYNQSKVGVYKVGVRVDTTVGVQRDADCSANFTIAAPPRTPVAVCSRLGVIITNHTNIDMSGAVTTNGGATVSKYTFAVTDESGKTVATRSVATNELSTEADAVTLKSPGKYTARLAVATSLGDKTDPQDCVKQFTVADPAVCAYNPALTPNHPDCQPCPSNPEIWIKDVECAPEFISTKTSNNISQGNVDASTVPAKASDRISYTINMENVGLTGKKVSLTESLGDILQYAQVIDMGGGTFNQATKELIWPEVEVAPKMKQTRTFVIRVLKTIPTTNTGTSDASSFDCHMTNTFGNSVDITIACPPEKVIVEQAVSELPTTGPGENMAFAVILFAVVVYFYARSRQLGKEVRLIRRDVTLGVI
ncbi:MAG: hypothetical protein ACSLEY_04220 [Candidatus Saccharimonadales bacterium]